MTEPNIVTVARRFDQPAERVFDAWLDPARARNFLFATETGEMVHAEIDPRVGGTFIFVDRRDGEDVLHTGKYTVIDRPHRLVFDFIVPKYSADRTTVGIGIVPDGEGCVLRLTHADVPVAAAEKSRAGWETILERSAQFV